MNSYSHVLASFYIMITRSILILLSILSYYINAYNQRNMQTSLLKSIASSYVIDFFWLCFAICFLIQCFYSKILYKAVTTILNLLYLQCEQREILWMTFTLLAASTIMLCGCLLCQGEIILELTTQNNIFNYICIQYLYYYS